jgi:endonuclease/exonuclease/phosphatase family metal-dependent hydrolase
LIDHILVTQGVGVSEAMVWNPYLEQETDEKTAQVKALKDTLLNASDHFPVSVVLDL